MTHKIRICINDFMPFPLSYLAAMKHPIKTSKHIRHVRRTGTASFTSRVIWPRKQYHTGRQQTNNVLTLSLETGI